MNSRFSYYTINRLLEQSDDDKKYYIVNLIKNYYETCNNKKSQINWDSLLVNYKFYMNKPKSIKNECKVSINIKSNISITSDKHEKSRIGFSDCFKSEYKAFVNILSKADDLNKSFSYLPSKLKLISKKKSKKSKISSKKTVSIYII